MLGRTPLVIGITAAAVTVAATAFASPAGAATASPWTNSNFNAAQSRDNLTESTLTPTTVRAINKVGTITGSSRGAGAGPCTSGGSVPVETGGFVYIVTSNTLVKANATTGATVWARVLDPTGTTVWGPIAVVGGIVVVGGNDCISQSDPNGLLLAYTTVGAKIWSSGVLTMFGGALSDMVVTGGFVVATGGSPGSGDVVGVHRLSTGVEVWSKNSPQCGFVDRVVVVGGVVIHKNCNTNADTPYLVANTLATGARIWARAGNWIIDAGDTDVSTGKDVYVTNPQGRITDITPQTGVIKGTFPSTAHGVLAVGNSRLFTACSAGICAYSRSTRGLVWSYGDTSANLIAAVGGTVMYLSDGAVLASETGALIRHLFTTSVDSLVVADGHLYAARTIYG